MKLGKLLNSECMKLTHMIAMGDEVWHVRMQPENAKDSKEPYLISVLDGDVSELALLTREEFDLLIADLTKFREILDMDVGM